jgi:predicted transcriptional regulator
MSVKTLEGLLLDELERRSTEGLTNREIREWSRYGRMQTTRLLQSLREKGKIVSSGKRGRGARYWLPQFVPKVQL